MSDFLSFWHAHTPIFSILIPLFTAVLLLLLGNPGSGELAQDWRQPWRRGISYFSALAGFATAISYLKAGFYHLLLLLLFMALSEQSVLNAYDAS